MRLADAKQNQILVFTDDSFVSSYSGSLKTLGYYLKTVFQTNIKNGVGIKWCINRH